MGKGKSPTWRYLKFCARCRGVFIGKTKYYTICKGCRAR